MKAERLNRGSFITHSTRTASINESNSKYKLSLDLPSIEINPEICLSRSNVLEQDKRIKLKKFMSQKLINNVSHLFDSESTKLTMTPHLNLNDNIFNHLADTNKRLPTSRFEVETLEK